jgi:RNA polymerase sigma-70 factor, ECF subfamily
VLHTHFTEQSDYELLECYQKTQNKMAITVLWERYSHLLYGQALHYFKGSDAPDNAKDVVQAALETLLTVENRVESPKAWLFTIVKNSCLKVIKYIDNKDVIDEDYDDVKKSQAYFVENNVLKTLIAAEDRERLRVAMEVLVEEQRICLELFYWEELSYKEIALKIGITTQKVNSNIQNGRLRLKRILLT